MEPRTHITLSGRTRRQRFVVGVARSSERPLSIVGPPEDAVVFAFDRPHRHLLDAFRARGPFAIVALLDEGIIGDILELPEDFSGTIGLRFLTRWAIVLPLDTVDCLGLEVGSTWSSDHPLPGALPAVPPVIADEPRSETDPWPAPTLVRNYSAREHLYASPVFSAGASRIPWQLRVGPRGEALWMHAGGAYLIAPRSVELDHLRVLCRDLQLAWLRIEFLPECEIVEQGVSTRLSFDPQDPAPWMERCRAFDLYPTVGRWLMTRTLLVDLAGDEPETFARLPTRIRYEIRATSRQVERGVLAFETLSAHRIDDRTWRAIEHLHAHWLGAHPGAEDNLDFCRPLIPSFGDNMTAHLLWRQEGGHKVELLALQLHVLWDRTTYYLFSETLAHAPNGAVNALIWHGTRQAMAKGADILDLVSAFDPRYPDFRAHGRNYTPMKLRWHPTSVWMPPSVAIPGLEMPP